MNGQTVVFGLAVFLVLFDCQNVLSWSRRKVLALPFAGGSHDYTILVPLYGDPAYFAGRARLERYKARVLVCAVLDDPRMPAFAERLEAEGWRVCRLYGMERPAAPKIVKEALASGLVTTSYVVRLDADTFVVDDLDRAVDAAKRAGADLCSVKCHVNAPRSWAQRFQALEYEMAMLSRHYRPAMTSGACFIARTEALREILDLHSLCYYGEDVETGWTAHALGMHIRHVDLVVETDAPATWRGLFRQRRSWWAATFRSSIVNFDRQVIHRPLWATYYGGLIYLGAASELVGVTPGVWESLDMLPFVFAVYVVLTFAVNWRVRRPLMVLFPLYALVQVTVMPLVGMARYARMWRIDGHPGRYRFPRRRRARPAPVVLGPAGVSW